MHSTTRAMPARLSTHAGWPVVDAWWCSNSLEYGCCLVAILFLRTARGLSSAEIDIGNGGGLGWWRTMGAAQTKSSVGAEHPSVMTFKIGETSSARDDLDAMMMRNRPA